MLKSKERMRETTPSAQSKDALRKERDLFSAVIDTAAVLVVILDPHGQIVRFNRACKQVTGYGFDEVKGKPFWDVFLNPEEAEAVKGVFGRLRAGQFPKEHENHWMTKDGRRRLIAWSNTALLDGHGSVEYIVGTGIDITERRRAEGALKESEKKYRRLIENLQEGVWAVDAEGRTTFVNVRMAEMLGYTVDEMLASSMFAFMDEHGIAMARQNLERQRQGIREQHDFELIRQDGVRLYTSMATLPIMDDDGNFIGALACVADITERKQAEVELQAALRRAQEVDRLKSQLLSTVSHELRTPLTSIRGQTSTLLDYADQVTPEDTAFS